ncbi:MAG: S9 family peptidase [Inhella sp.]|jgi:dipeptidyl aminopeptidase/acylaminoacyl peptidase|uniref:S9 family peptidase n=2 Tax=Inhella sp. TaxID=1921806 RepID=UPI00391C0819
MRLKPFDVDALWALARIGEPSLSPDGSEVVAAVTRHDMESNTARSALYRFSTLGGEPQRLTEAGDKDAAPQWSPDGAHIGFIAKREQGGVKDEEPQLYLLPTAGGEARRAGRVPTGVVAFRWLPDARRVLLVSWVWPDLRSMDAQAKALAAHKARKDTAYVTSEALYRHWDHHVPQGRVPHLLMLDTATGKAKDLFAGTRYELTRTDPGLNDFAIAPGGRRAVFVVDLADEKRVDNLHALAEVDLRSGEVRVLLHDPEWDFSAPAYSHAGQHLAFLAARRGHRHTAPEQLAVLDTHGQWAALSADWDRAVAAPLRWTDDDLAIRFTAEDRGRRHLWRFDLNSRGVQREFEGGNATAFDAHAGAVVVLHDSVQFPPRLSVLTTSTPRRIESLNDAALATHAWGRHEEVVFTGAQGDEVQMWLVYPPSFNPRRKHAVMHVIHGGPHTAFGDSWHWRWNHQVMAQQGYVVACVNYHGSSSFGHAFLDSITHRWGQLELQDVEAATDWLLDQPWVDAKRIVATGGSYGGYMVAWMNGHVKPGRYQAYVCHAGCYDWQAMFATDGYTWFPKELGAAYWDDPAHVASQSPHARAQHFATPTLVMHGAMDYRVPDAQGLAYYNTLKARGVAARLVWFPDENHWVLKPRNSQLWYGEFFAWLAAHTAPRASAKKKAKR